MSNYHLWSFHCEILEIKVTISYALPSIYNDKAMMPCSELCSLIHLVTGMDKPLSFLSSLHLRNHNQSQEFLLEPALGLVGVSGDEMPLGVSFLCAKLTARGNACSSCSNWMKGLELSTEFILPRQGRQRGCRLWEPFKFDFLIRAVKNIYIYILYIIYNSYTLYYYIITILI